LNPRYERWRRLTFASTWFIYGTLYFTRQAFGVAKVAIGHDERVSLSRDDMGMVDSAFLTTYMLGQFIFGPLGDRFGPRRILLAGVTLSVLAAVASGFATTFAAFTALAVVQGVAQSTGWSNTTKTMSSWFSLRERGRVIGWWCTHYTVCAAVALPFCGWMMDFYGHMGTDAQGQPMLIPYWPAAFWSAAAVLAIVGVFAALTLRNRPEDLGLSPIEEYHGEPQSLIDDEDPRAPVSEGSWKLVGEVLASPSIWMLAFAYFSIKLTRYAFIFWGAKYVDEALHSDAFTSTLTAAAMPIGGMVGVVGIGYVSDKLFQARRAPAAVLSLLAAALIMLLGLIRINDAWLMSGFFFLVGMFLFGPDSVISATASMDFGTKRGAGTATGFVNGIGSIGGILGGYLPGKITTGSDWTPLFVVLLVGLVASACLLAPLWRTRPPTA
jgi:OPA family sugar phosphate sensor protein UhpC-like MFS transporter